MRERKILAPISGIGIGTVIGVPFFLLVTMIPQKGASVL